MGNRPDSMCNTASGTNCRDLDEFTMIHIWHILVDVGARRDQHIEARRLGAGSDASSHRQFQHAEKPGTVTIAGKPGADLPPGTLNNILKQAGLK